MITITFYLSSWIVNSTHKLDTRKEQSNKWIDFFHPINKPAKFSKASTAKKFHHTFFPLLTLFFSLFHNFLFLWEYSHLSSITCKARQELEKFLILFKWKWWRVREWGISLDWMSNPSNMFFVVVPSNLFIRLHTCKHKIYSSQTSHFSCIMCIILPTYQLEE